MLWTVMMLKWLIPFMSKFASIDTFWYQIKFIIQVRTNKIKISSY